MAAATFVASAPRTAHPADRFASFLPHIQPSLERFARSEVGDFAEDVVGDVILLAFSSLDRFDFATGEQGARSWLFAILQRRIMGARRQQAQEMEHAAQYADLRIRDVAVERGRRAMREELEERLEVVRPSLSPLQAEALEGMMAGDSDRATAARLGTSRRAVNRAKLDALDKCRRTVSVERPQLSAQRWRAKNWEGGNEVTIYHPPQKTGAGLANMTPAQRAANLRAI